MNDTHPKKPANPILSAGTVPPNHRGPYIPSHAEMLEGARAVAKIQESIAVERSRNLESDLAEVFKNWEKR